MAPDQGMAGQAIGPGERTGRARGCLRPGEQGRQYRFHLPARWAERCVVHAGAVREIQGWRLRGFLDLQDAQADADGREALADGDGNLHRQEEPGISRGAAGVQRELPVYPR